MAHATYRFFVDWHKDGLLDIAGFEFGTGKWTAHGTQPPQLSQVKTSGARSGQAVMQIDWIDFQPFTFGDSARGFDSGRFGPFEFSNPSDAFTFGSDSFGFDTGRFGYVSAQDTEVHSPSVRRAIPALETGEQYRLSVWVLNKQDAPITVDIVEVSDSSMSSNPGLGPVWEELTVDFTAPATEITLRFRYQGDLSIPTNPQTWIDHVRVFGTDVEITDRLLNTGVSVEMGRDASRNLSDVNPGSMGFELLNKDYRFTPDNQNSNLFGFLDPGRPVQMVAEYGDKEYTLFRGYVDGMKLKPTPLGTVDFTAQDILGLAAETDIDTGCHAAIQTGDAVHLILDAMDWPADRRDVDRGASTLRYWCEDGSNALEALKRVMRSEGLPSIIYVDDRGFMVFRDRHHRIMRSESIAASTTFYDKYDPELEPKFADPYDYDLGFEDIQNEVKFTVKEGRLRFDTEEPVWKSEDSWVIPNLSTESIEVELQDPCMDAITPTVGTDFQSYGLGTPLVKLSKTSGQKLKILITATGGEITVQGLQLRAKTVETVDYTVTASDEASIGHYGLKSHSEELPFVNRNDAKAIADIVLGHRARRTPTISFEVNNNSQERLTHILARRISDRIHVIEPETFVDHDFYIERVSHNVEATGKVHKAQFSCERVSDQHDNVFRFDDADHGFDNGVFGVTGLTQPTDIFVLGQSNLGEHLLAF